MVLYSVSLVVHKNVEFTKRCVSSLLDTVPNDELEILVYDNASRDGTREFFNSLSISGKCAVFYVESEKNDGFIAAQNFLSRMATGKYFIPLNNDTELIGDWISRMRAEFENNPRLGLVGFAGTCSVYDRNLRRGRGANPGERPNYVEASCLMMPVDLMKKIGLFNTRMKFGYCEDTDLSFRVQAHGYEIKLLNIPFKHHRAKTRELVKGLIDVEGYEFRNHYVLNDTWDLYMRTGKFLMKPDRVDPPNLSVSPGQQIIVQRKAALGDVLLITPLLRELRSRFPSSPIHTVTGFPQFFERNPSVTSSEHWSTFRKSPPNSVFLNLDDAYESRPDSDIVSAYARASGVPIMDRRPEIHPSGGDVEWAERELGTDEWVIVHVGPKPWIACNPPAESVQRVLDALPSLGLKSVLVGVQTNVRVSGTLDLRGKTTVHQLAALTSLSKMYFGIDSFPMHVAECFGIPRVVPFGTIDPEMVASTTAGLFPVRHPFLSCLGCHHYQPAPRHTEKVCPRWPDKKFPGEARCMSELSPDLFLSAIHRALAGVAT